MTIQNDTTQNTIERRVHCPYCGSEEAMLISQLAEKKSTLQMPAFGLKFLLCTVYTLGLYPLVHGFPAFEKKRTYQYQTYGFCPFCGKTYNAGVPQAIQQINQPPKLYRSRYNKKIFGICGGIAEYTGLPAQLIRILTVLYCFTALAFIPYLLLGGLNIIPETPNQ